MSGSMDFDGLLADLRAMPARLRGVLHGVGDADLRRRPADGGWCIAEVLGHLLDEERRDFRVRVDFTLHRPGEPWPALDPGAAVREGRWHDADAAATLEEFVRERGESLAALERWRGDDWHSFREHPRAGRLHAGDLLAAWAVHDALHLRQIGRLLAEGPRARGAPFHARYAE